MAKLIPPAQDTMMVKYGEYWNKNTWHILSKKKNDIFDAGRAVCGTVCIDPQYKMLMSVPAKFICKKCWPFGVEK